ncbi:shikimate dehydrogenase [Clostridium cellulovorans]|uniref:Shikimate dehydrogenase (NADP(+)) n=1 Tax=Clostridium cellulovorans (strain ATCC 35296 / DSM 3052 / OCM 3 / 743B) TaxID=573061 RepID=D9SVB0_CLOC7|nr:shikimate dehydrogenase [Clostridium cellulovorans]ADL51034.1 shikimate 5-dehydrogenase [Clostridium cellulovorans 743B]
MEKHLYGLIGEKLGHSLSPQIHERIIDHLGVKGHYDLYELERNQVCDAVKAFKLLGFKGINVTIPYKIDVIEHLDWISKEAETIGAVNTVHFKDNKVFGYNTDYYGFGMMLDAFGVSVEGKTVAVLGTGGSANSVICYFRDKGAKEIVLVSREKKDGCITYEELALCGSMDVVVNTTPVGMFPKVENSPVDKEILSKFKVAVDLIFNPMETLFLRHAREAGLKTVNGLYMLVGQAIKAQEIWNNTVIEDKVVEQIYQYILKEFSQKL